jgi:Tol biopolymer transport system component
MHPNNLPALLAATALTAGCTDRMQPTEPAVASSAFGTITPVLACDGPHAPATAASAGEFGAPVNLGPVINSPGFDGGPSVSPSELVLFLASDRPGGQGNSDIWMATRTGKAHAFESPVNVGPFVNSAANESAPEISADGLSLYFDSDRPGGFGPYDIWVARRATLRDPFGPPENLGPQINTTESEGHPSISADGLELFFMSSRQGGFGDADLWVAKRSTPHGPFGPAENLGPGLNGPGYDSEPSIANNGLTLFFASDRAGGFGLRDLWVTKRNGPHGTFGPPQNLGPVVNTQLFDVTPEISTNGSTLYFMSNRPGGVGWLDLWQTTRNSPSKGCAHADSHLSLSK